MANPVARDYAHVFEALGDTEKASEWLNYARTNLYQMVASNYTCKERHLSPAEGVDIWIYKNDKHPHRIIIQASGVKIYVSIADKTSAPGAYPISLGSAVVAPAAPYQEVKSRILRLDATTSKTIDNVYAGGKLSILPDYGYDFSPGSWTNGIDVISWVNYRYLLSPSVHINKSIYINGKFASITYTGDTHGVSTNVTRIASAALISPGKAGITSGLYKKIAIVLWSYVQNTDSLTSSSTPIKHTLVMYGVTFTTGSSLTLSSPLRFIDILDFTVPQDNIFSGFTKDAQSLGYAVGIRSNVSLYSSLVQDVGVITFSTGYASYIKTQAYTYTNTLNSYTTGNGATVTIPGTSDIIVCTDIAVDTDGHTFCAIFQVASGFSITEDGSGVHTSASLALMSMSFTSDGYNIVDTAIGGAKSYTDTWRSSTGGLPGVASTWYSGTSIAVAYFSALKRFYVFNETVISLPTSGSRSYQNTLFYSVNGSKVAINTQATITGSLPSHPELIGQGMIIYGGTYLGSLAFLTPIGSIAENCANNGKVMLMTDHVADLTIMFDMTQLPIPSGLGPTPFCTVTPGAIDSTTISSTGGVAYYPIGLISM